MCSSAATPLPLSFRPGPAGTESRWPPAITTRGASSGPVSAITLVVSRRSDTARTVDRRAAARQPFAGRRAERQGGDAQARAAERGGDRPLALVDHEHGGRARALRRCPP